MIAKLRVIALFILANAMGSLMVILPASPADRDQGQEVSAPDHRESQAGGGGRDRNRRGEWGDPSLLINHDVFYTSCIGGGDCGDDRGEHDHPLRPDLINAEPPPGLFPFADEGGQSRGSPQSSHDSASGTAPFGAMPSALFPFLPGTPLAGAPGGAGPPGGTGGGGPGGGGPGGGGAGGPGADGASPDYPGLGADAGAPSGAPGSGGDLQPMSISGLSGVPSSAAEEVPEPASLPLLAAGVLALIVIGRHRKRAARTLK